MKEFKQVCYISSLNTDFKTHEIIAELKATAKFNNEKHGITGCLLYSDCIFMQLIEGKSLNVDILYRIIQDDKRHLAPRIVFSQESDHRAFPKWSMLFSETSNLDSTTVSKIFSIYKASNQEKHISKEEIISLFSEFIEKMY